jgi:Cft2 family RNA processing exonuclease
MSGFETSKGYQGLILMTPATRDLLIAEYNAELPSRSNIKTLEPGGTFDYEGQTIKVGYSCHMLGAVQVSVEMEDSYKVSYSSDFDESVLHGHVLTTDELVIDATYGDPEQQRDYNQQEVINRFVELVLEKLSKGPVYIKAYRGRLEYAMELLSEETNVPFITTQRQKRVVEVCQQYGHMTRSPLPYDSPDARQLIQAGEKYVVFCELRDSKRIPEVENRYTIALTALWVPKENPVLELSDNCCRIALTDHADFRCTLEYIKASGACCVVTDNSRGGNAQALAEAIRKELGIPARVASHVESRFWGGNG